MKQDYNHIIIRDIKYHFKVVFTIGILVLLLFSKCVKDSETKPEPFEPKVCETCLPEITTSGKNTFGCKVNGKIWLPMDGFMTPGIRLDYFNNNLTIVGYHDALSQKVGFSLTPIMDTGLYDFATYNFSAMQASFKPNIEDRDKFFYYEIPSSGYLKIVRFDKKAGIVSGIFEFDAMNNEGDTARITDGRFDLHF